MADVYRFPCWQMLAKYTIFSMDPVMGYVLPNLRHPEHEKLLVSTQPQRLGSPHASGKFVGFGFFVATRRLKMGKDFFQLSR